MLHLKQIMPRKKRITTVGIVIAVGIAAIAVSAIAVMGYYPAIYGTGIDAFSSVSEGLSNISAVASEDAKTAIAYIRSQLEQQLM